MTVQNVVTYDVVILVKNPELKLRPGMTANASILVAQKENVLKIPNSALRFRPEFAKRDAAAPQKATPRLLPPLRPPRPRGEQILERLKAELKLTPEQQAGISRILKDAQAEIQAARKAGGAEEAKAKAKELRAATRVKIRSLLTEEQKKKYDQMDQRPESSPGSGPGVQGLGPHPGGETGPGGYHHGDIGRVLHGGDLRGLERRAGSDRRSCRRKQQGRGLFAKLPSLP